MRFTAALFLLLSITTQVHASQEKLIFALDLIRHGDRTPLHEFPRLSHHWEQGLGQLTLKGIEQHFELGKKLREKYVYQYQLLPETYLSNTVYVRSTDYDRTLMSAQSLLMGLYPLVSMGGRGSSYVNLPAYHPIPIHTFPAKQDTLIPYYMDNDAFKKYLFPKYAFPQKIWQEKIEEVKAKFKQWGEVAGVDIQSLHQVVRLGDTLHIHRLHHAPIPQSLSREEINEIIQLGSWAHAALFKPKEIGSTLGSDTLANIVNYLQQASQGKSPLKYVLLSGHDSSILALLSAMRAPLNASPPYASHVNFALFEKNSGGYQVVIRFNDEPVFVPACGGHACTLEQLQALAAEAKANIDILALEMFKNNQPQSLGG